MIRPVCVYHSYLCDSRVALFGVAEVIAAEAYIVKVHSKTKLVQHRLEILVRRIDEPVNSCNARGNIVLYVKRLERVKACLARLHGVYHIALYLRHLLVREITRNDVNSRRLDNRALSARQQRDTLRARICTLVKLSRQILHRKHKLAVLDLRQVIVCNIDRRLGEHHRCCQREILL